MLAMARTDRIAAAATGGDQQDRYVDVIRAFSLLVVVAWHWVFTIIVWEDDGPHATNPIGFTTGLWLATWLFQVMPLFFYVGGYGHLRSWERAQARGESIWHLVGRRLRRLAIPSLALLCVWLAVGLALSALFRFEGIGRTVILVVSPLWFIAVYRMLVLLLPLMLWLHQRFDTIVLVVLAGGAGAVDIIRFEHDVEWIGLLNMVLVWGLCHQLGFSTSASSPHGARSTGHSCSEGCSASPASSAAGSTRDRWSECPANVRTWPRRRCASSPCWCSRPGSPRSCRARQWSGGCSCLAGRGPTT
jgi:hypothetical protein